MSWLMYVFRFGEDRREKSHGNQRKDDVTACCNQEKWKSKSCFPDLTTFQGSLSSHWKSNSRTLSVCTFFWNICYALVGVEQKSEHQTVKKRMQIPSPGRTHAGLQAGSPAQGVQEATTYWYFSPSLFLPFPSLLKIYKIFKKWNVSYIRKVYRSHV